MPARKTPAEINAATLKAWWKNDEASGTRADYSGNSNTLTDNNTVTAREGFRANRSAYFNSANSEYLSITDAAQVGLDPYDSATGKYTVWGEIRLDSLAAAVAWYTKYDDPNYGLLINITTGGRIDVSVNSGGITASSASGVITAGRKHEIAVVFDSVNDLIIFYVDGICVGRVAWTGTFLSTSTAPIRLGAYYASIQQPFNGQMGWTAVWADALTPAQIMSLSGIDDVFCKDTGGEEHLRSSASLNVKIAQSFNPKVTGYFDSVILNAYKNNSPTGNVWVTIETDNAGAPSGVAVATSEQIDVSLVSTSVSYLDLVFRFSTAFQLTGGTTYWIVVQGDYSVSSTVGLRFQRSSGGAGNYTGGAAYTYNGTSWSAISTDDFKFRMNRIVGNLIDSHFLEAGTNDYQEFYSNNNRSRFAQNIKFTSNKAVKGAVCWLTMTASPTGTLNIKIYDNNAGVPGSVLATGTAYNRNIGQKTSSGITRANGGLWYVEFASPLTLSANTEYWISFEASAGGDGSNYNTIFVTSGNGYASTYDAKYYNGSWNSVAANYDLQFALFEDIQQNQGNFFPFLQAA